MGARGFKHRRMQLLRLETCRLPGLKEPNLIKWLEWTTLVQSDIECLSREREPAERLVGRAVERLIGLVKSALLRWKELQEVLLDVEITLNNRPLSYAEDDVQMPFLTPNAMLFLNSNLLPELQPHHIETADLRKRAKHLLKCRKAIWSRWTKEYLRSLRERHRAQRGAGGDAPAVGDVVIVKTEDKRRGKWPLGIIENIILWKNLILWKRLIR